MNNLKIRLKDGWLVASKSSDPSYPGIDVEYIADNDNGETASRPRVLVESPEKEGLRALVWGEPNNEDYTEEIEFKI